jgi:hypothetical protein
MASKKLSKLLVSSNIEQNPQTTKQYHFLRIKTIKTRHRKTFQKIAYVREISGY